jgi:hypothetical protein
MLRAKKAITISLGISAGVSNGSSTAESPTTPIKAANQRIASPRLENSSAPSGAEAVNDQSTIPLEERNPPRLSLQEEGQHEPERELGRPERPVPLRPCEDREIGDAHDL